MSVVAALILWHGMESSFTVPGTADGTVLSVSHYRYSSRVVYAHDGSRACTFVPYTVAVKPGDSISCRKAKAIQTDSVFSRSLQHEGITKSAYYSEECTITPSGPESRKRIIRDALFNRIDSCVDESTAALLKALIVGSKHYLDKQTIYNFKKAGLLHLLAASGMHVGIIAGVLFLILGRLPVSKKSNLLICSVVLAGYLYLTDVPVSLLRACIMFWIFTLCTLTDSFRNPFNILFMSGIIILIIHPSELYGLGFQLSFLATFGILLTYTTFSRLLPKLPLKISESVSLSLSAQMFVIPVIYITLGEFNTAGIAATIPAVPLLTGILYFSFAVIGISFIHPRTAQAAGLVPSALNFLLNQTTAFFSNLNLHTSQGTLLLVAVPVALFFFSAFVNRFNRYKAPALLAAIVLLSSAILMSHPGSSFRMIGSRINKHMYLIHDGNTVVLCGSVAREDADAVVRYISDSGADRIIILATYNPQSSSFKPVVTALPVSRCIFLNDYADKTREKLITLLSRDGIPYETATAANLDELNTLFGRNLLKAYERKIIFDKNQFRTATIGYIDD
ncbi:MAG: ComEC/Rec2 family competence protein, partial [Spirochaetota bacterium]